jgi:hypothetical protein
MSQEIVPFRVAVPDAELDELRRRLRATRWPDREVVADWSQGIPLAYVQEVCRYWAEKYDWRAREARLNGFPQFRTEIDGLGIHFLHVRSPNPDALPLVITHGWPGSVIEFLKVIGPIPVTPSTSSRPRCPATASPTSRARRAGAPSGSRRRGRSSWRVSATAATSRREATGARS